MNIAKLVARGRLHPIHKWDGEGKCSLVGYERGSNSRKAKQKYWLKTPVSVSDEEAAKLWKGGGQ